MIAFESLAQPLVPEDHSVWTGLDTDPTARATFMIYMHFPGLFILSNAAFGTGLDAGCILTMTARERHGEEAIESSLAFHLFDADPVHRHLRFAHGIDKAL